MTDYIRREDAIEAFDPQQRRDWYTPWIVETLEDLPSADVEPIRRGHWIEDQDRIVCSECGARFKDEIIYMQENKPVAPHRCLECGAIMYGGIEDE